MSASATIHFECGTCGQPLFADAAAAGQEVRCSNCHATIIVPAPSPSESPLPPISGGSAAPKAAR
jgi:DNA-directed RNA polymerase subunit RPC12/RpoP